MSALTVLQWKPTRSFTAREIEVKKKRLEQMVAARSQLNEAKARQEKQEEMNHMVSHALKDFEKERRARESCCAWLAARGMLRVAESSF